MLEKTSVQNIKTGILKLNEFNSTPGNGTTRVLFTPPELEAREYVKQLMRASGLSVSEDAAGNIFGMLAGLEPALPQVWTGSHIDTVLNAGMFDGMAGVIGGIEAARVIRESGAPRRRGIAVVVYTSEEPTRFGLSCLGSRALAGKLTLEQAGGLIDKDGESLSQVLAQLGHDLRGFDRVRKSPGDVFAAVELHIEQNDALDKKKKRIGIVKSICAPSNYLVTITGRQGHAGGTSMDDRLDAFAACCEISLKLEKLAKKSTSEYTTATVGKVEVLPNAANVIPGHVEFTVDIRDTDYAHKKSLMEDLTRFIRELEIKRRVLVEITCLNEDIPARCDASVSGIIRDICREKEEDYEELISGAYHDSLMVGLFAPVSMIFVPSRNGISHSKDEWTDFEDVALGADVLAETLLRLSNLESLRKGDREA